MVQEHGIGFTTIQRNLGGYDYDFDTQKVTMKEEGCEGGH
jgi:hypothetical protein